MKQCETFASVKNTPTAFFCVSVFLKNHLPLCLFSSSFGHKIHTVDGCQNGEAASLRSLKEDIWALSVGFFRAVRGIQDFSASPMVQSLAILQADCVFIACFQKGLHYELARKLKPSWLSHTACNIAEKPVPLWLRFSKDTDYLNALTSLVSEWPPQNISESLFLEKTVLLFCEIEPFSIVTR